MAGDALRSLSGLLRRLTPLAAWAAASGGCYVGVDDPESGSEAASLSASAGDTSAGEGGDDEGGDDGDTPPPNLDPADAKLRILLSRHYKNSVRDLLGEAAAATVTPPADTALNGFDAIGAASFALSDAAIDAYEASARAAAAAAIQDTGRIAGYLGCTPSGPGDAACHEAFVRSFGRLAWRRPLDQDEVGRYVAVAQAAAAERGDFYAGVENTIATFLQSPYFLYQVEIGAADPEQPSRRWLSGYELATRMSFFLLDTTPSAALLAAAAAGELDTAEGIRAAAAAMLAEPGARAALSSYFGELLRIRGLDALAKDTQVYPQWSPELALAMRKETELLIEDIVWQRDSDFREILDAPYTFVNELLGPLYGLPPPGGGVFTSAFVKVPLPKETKRGGILGQGALLARFAHISSTSPTLRGKFVREALLCESIPAPPGDVSTVIPPEGEAAPTMRERLEQHLTDPNCAACHLAMDPIGFGLENFNGIGVFRAMENGATIDTASELSGYGAFDGARELGAVLKGSPNVSLCALRNLFRHGVGAVEGSSELVHLVGLEEAFAAQGYRLQDALIELVASPPFRMVGAPE
jgi:hypothetical protein